MIAAAVLAAAQLFTPTVYSSLPMHGPARAQARAVQQGEQLALADAGSPLKLVTLDDSNARAGHWTPEGASADARRAAEDENAIGYIGEFNSGASEVSIPILNEAGIAEISPSNTEEGLTVAGPGTEPGQPLKYYPTDHLNYFRLTPRDAVQGAGLGAELRQAGCRHAALLDDRRSYGVAIAAAAGRTAAARGVTVVARRHVGRRRRYTALARALRHARADCVLFAGLPQDGAVRVFRDVARALPQARFFGPDGLAQRAFTAQLPAALAARTLLTLPTLPPDAYPSAGQRAIAAFGDVYAAYGYEAMQLFIDAYTLAGPNRAAIIGWLQQVRNRAGAVGTFSFDRHGDTTVRTVGLYAIRGGALTPLGTVSG
jgi:branched-chain amino acid transport system substrate-binding protein